MQAPLPALCGAAALLALVAPVAHAGDRGQTTQLISRSAAGGVPNGPSTNGVISNDRRYARLAAYQSDASNIVRGDTNGQTDVFAVRRAGRIDNSGRPWRRGGTIRVSRTRAGGPANGPSFAPAVSGGFRARPRCVAFLSAASNIARSDTNGVVDAFVTRRLGRAPVRLLLPGRRQPTADVTQVAIADDCSRVAFVSAGGLYVATRRGTRRVPGPAPAADPAFMVGRPGRDLVFAAPAGVYLWAPGGSRSRLIAPGGSNPSYASARRRTVAYEIDAGGHRQIGYRDVGGRQRIVSSKRGVLGNGDSRDPVINNGGFYVSFETAATNLQLNPENEGRDSNGRDDVYLFSDVRDITLVQSVRRAGVPLPGGGANPSMSTTANYILFDSPAPFTATDGPHQVFMRYLGGI